MAAMMSALAVVCVGVLFAASQAALSDAAPVCGAVLPNYLFYHNINFYGGDFSHNSNMQLDSDCAAQCSNTPQCLGFETVRSQSSPGQGLCWFKNVIRPGRNQLGQDAFIKCNSTASPYPPPPKQVNQPPPTTEQTVGQFLVVVEDLGISPMHVILSYKDTVIFLDRTDVGPTRIIDKRTNTYAYSVEYNLNTKAVRGLDVVSNSFCSAGQAIANGLIVNVAGNGDSPYRAYYAIRRLTPCNDGSCDWEVDANVALVGRRWYPTAQKQADGNVAVIGGGAISINSYQNNKVTSNFYNQTYEFAIKDPNLPKPVTPVVLPILNQAWPWVLYPIAHLLQNGNTWIYAGAFGCQVNLAAGGNCVPGTTSPPLYDEARKRQTPRTHPFVAGSAMWPLQPNDKYAHHIMVCGGGNITTERTCGVAHISPDGSSYWTYEIMPGPRVMGAMHILPDGNIIIINGCKSGFAGYYGCKTPEMVVWMYTPPADRTKTLYGTWKKMANSTIPRVYHSTSTLIPSGAILVSGSNTRGSYTTPASQPPPYGTFLNTEFRVQEWRPPYFFSSMARPTINNKPAGYVPYGQTFTITVTVTDPYNNFRFHLIDPGFNTHAQTMGQRLVVLERIGDFNGVGGGKFTVTLRAPPSATIAPPGYYLLYVVEQGIPSTGKWVQILSSSGLPHYPPPGPIVPWVSPPPPQAGARKGAGKQPFLVPVPPTSPYGK